MFANEKTRISNESDNEINHFQSQIRFEEINKLFEQYPYTIISKENYNQRMQSDTNALNIDLHVLQTLINDYHTMMDELFQNSINTTYTTDAIHNDHLKIDLLLITWCYLICFCLISLCIGLIIYIWVSQVGFNRSNPCLSNFLKCLISPLHKQQKCSPQLEQQQQQSQQDLAKTQSIDQKKELSSAMAFNSVDIV
ncbi:unnamed protein product [Rotaria sp. Silwood2]|nr:unnamed protein product [Rotaria sp. Silwood2]CAF2947543.1 unnamed protein product [Rotaria sp. Silwood2]CAF3321108.1 unnamed protein product [Rotaria sp. Silwood2]CAF3407615.1 unnamed protein product [Rotaria sp. Silwood2]CAF4133823.1 unnamed protein product [Rotaria sp. Silwood2]